MSAFTVHQLFVEYQKERNTKVNEDQFIFFIVFFPSLLVIISDGIVDLEEWEYVKQLSHFIAKSFKEEDHENVNVAELATLYRHEISYLTKHLGEWQDKFLEALQYYLNDHPEFKETVLETMELFAEASEGTSSHEEERIVHLIELLKLKQ